MKKTKIICTMGPNTNDETLMRKLVQNGMDIARFNFSHGDHEEQKWMIRIWNSGIAQNVMAIMNIARIICSHIHMLNN